MFEVQKLLQIQFKLRGLCNDSSFQFHSRAPRRHCAHSRTKERKQALFNILLIPQNPIGMSRFVINVGKDEPTTSREYSLPGEGCQQTNDADNSCFRVPRARSIIRSTSAPLTSTSTTLEKQSDDQLLDVARDVHQNLTINDSKATQQKIKSSRTPRQLPHMLCPDAGDRVLSHDNTNPNIHAPFSLLRDMNPYKSRHIEDFHGDVANSPIATLQTADSTFGFSPLSPSQNPEDEMDDMTLDFQSLQIIK